MPAPRAHVLFASANADERARANASLATAGCHVLSAADGSADHFLLLEHTPIPEFTLASGESFNLLVDGTRHAFAPTNSPAAIVSRPGFTTLTFRATPQLFVDIANARNVELRLKGMANVVEKRLSRASVGEFKTYLLKYFQQPPASPNATVTKSAQRD